MFQTIKVNEMAKSNVNLHKVEPITEADYVNEQINNEDVQKAENTSGFPTITSQSSPMQAFKEYPGGFGGKYFRSIRNVRPISEASSEDGQPANKPNIVDFSPNQTGRHRLSDMIALKQQREAKNQSVRYDPKGDILKRTVLGNKSSF